MATQGNCYIANTHMMIQHMVARVARLRYCCCCKAGSDTITVVVLVVMRMSALRWCFQYNFLLVLRLQFQVYDFSVYTDTAPGVPRRYHFFCFIASKICLTSCTTAPTLKNFETSNLTPVVLTLKKFQVTHIKKMVLILPHEAKYMPFFAFDQVQWLKWSHDKHNTNTERHMLRFRVSYGLAQSFPSFSRGSAEPQGSTSGCQAFQHSRPKLPGLGSNLQPVLCGFQ